MIKQIKVAECDVCGAVEAAKPVSGRYNETEYVMPDGWKKGNTESICICKKCAAKLFVPDYTTDGFGNQIKRF